MLLVPPLPHSIANPGRSARFYHVLFGPPPVEESPPLPCSCSGIREQTGALVQRHRRTPLPRQGHGAPLPDEIQCRYGFGRMAGSSDHHPEADPGWSLAIPVWV